MKTILLISPYWKEDHRWMVSTVKLAELSQRLGFRVVVVCMGEEEATGHKPQATGTLEIYRKKDFFLKDPWNYGIAFGFSGFVMKLVHDIKPDVIVCNKILFWTSLSVIRLRLAGHKVILLTDALVGITWWPRGWLPKACSAIYAWTLGWLIMTCAEKIVFFHPQQERILRRLGVLRKSQVIPTGIDASAYGRDAKLKTQDSSSVTITYVGRLESIKGVDDFLAAAVPLKAQHPQITIQVVGWYREGHELVRQYENDVTFTGLRDDIPAILGASDIFVLPSHSEGLSNALMEAMASGCACVATDVGGNAYLIQNGVSGFLFPVGDREALQSHLARLIGDPAKRRAMGEAAAKRIQEVFSWDIVGKQYENLFAELRMKNQELRGSTSHNS